MIIAKGNQRPQLQLDRSISSIVREGSSLQFVVDDCCILLLNHEDRLLEPQSLDFKGENRKRIETKAGLVFKAERVNGPRVLIRRQVVAAIIDYQRLFQLCQHHDAAHRWFSRRCQQTVIATSVQTDDGRRREAAETICFEPLARCSCREIVKRVMCEFDHKSSLSDKRHSFAK